MDDGASSPNMFESFSGNNLDYELMDELFDDGYWLETTKESKFSLLEPNIYDFNPNLYQQNYGQGVERSDFDETHLLDNPLMVDFGKKQTTNREVILANSYSDHSEKFLIESSEPNKRLWIAPLANPAPFVSVKNRLMCAIEYLGKLTKDSDVLIQIWVPIKREGKQFLTTDDQPFTCNDKSTSLANFRDVSKKYNFPAEEDSKDFIGLPGRVFLKKKLEWTPDVRFFKIEEYPRVNYAQQCNVSGSLALPVFERESGNCLGVVEIVRTTRMINHRLELENICKALEAVDLRSSEISSPPSVKGCDDSYEAVLSEIRQVLQYVCDAHNLPLAQTWALCAQEGKSECCLDSNKTPSLCISIIESACYVRDEKVRPYHEACSQHCLNIGEGIVGEAFVSNQPCFATDIAAFSKTDYPLSHYTKMFDLHGSVAIRLRSMYTGSADFVLEFFLPSDCTDVDEQWRMLGLLSSGIQRVCRSLRVLTDDEAERENIVLLSEKSVERENIITDAQGKGKGLDIASEYKESEFEVFEEKPQFENENIYQDLGSKGGGESGGEFFRSVGKKSGEKRRTKSEKNISLQVLRQYFAGSLKDAAKSIGVCPTTLKRICRQHGITRWPSRKIKKVGHSLRKLQLVIDSVQGVEGPIQLNSFYSNFPELSSTNIMNKCSAPQLEDHLKPFSTQLEASVSSPATTTSKSSCSQSSGSSFSTEEKPPLVTTSLAEQPPLRALSETELHELGREGKKHLAKSQSDENLRMENRNSKDGSGFHVKATFGEEKIRFSLQQNWVFGDVKKEILRRFHIDENGKIDLKYLDDDSEWVLLTCDADLEECIDIHRSTKSRTIKITVHHGFNSNIVGSFGSSVLS